MPLATDTLALTVMPTPRQLEVLRLVARHLLYREIGCRLRISPRTVEHHVEHARRRMGIVRRDDLIMYLILHGLIEWTLGDS